MDKYLVAAAKESLVELVKDHKARCDGKCGISLLFIRLLAEAGGATFTDTEKAIFT